MKKIITILAFTTPLFTFAVTSTNSIGTVLGTILGILNTVIPLLISVGVLYFIWGVVDYTLSGSTEKKEQGQQHMIWGIIGITVIVSIWGLVAVLSNTFGTADNNTQPAIPCINVDGVPGPTSADGC